MRLDLAQQRLLCVSQHILGRQRQRFAMLTAKLDAMSPLKVLTRGYAMAQQEDGGLIRNIGDVASGDTVSISLADGSFTATVNEVKERKP